MNVIRAIPRKDDAAVARVKDWLEAQAGYWLGRADTDLAYFTQTRNEAERQDLMQRATRNLKRADKAGGYRLAHEGDAA